jgi:hypothetical protein
MNFASEASKIVTNKYFLYFIVFLAASNVLGYIVTNKINAVIFFALVSFLMSNFSKNMAIILLVAIIATNLLMANKSMREGLENATMTDEQKANISAKAESDTDKLSSVDRQLGAGLSVLKKSGNSEEAKAKIAARKSAAADTTTTDTAVAEDTEEAFEDMESKNIVDPNNRDSNKRKTESFGAKAHASGKKTGFHNKKGGSSFSNAAPVNGASRIDYATTLENAYSDLDNILESGNIGKLTNDTQKLMTQQQKLFDTMNNMMPMIESAKSMVETLDMSQLGGLTEMANSLNKK